MDLSSASQCSNGCESGWTLYLDQSSFSRNQCYDFGGNNVNEEEEEVEEDLSMVSDASSGPRHHYCEEEDEYFLGDDHGNNNLTYEMVESKKCKSKKKVEEEEFGRNYQVQQHSYLDDTASSPVLGFSKKKMGYSKNESSMKKVFDFSQGFSATHFKNKSSLSKNPIARTTSGFQGRKWE